MRAGLVVDVISEGTLVLHVLAVCRMGGSSKYVKASFAPSLIWL